MIELAALMVVASLLSYLVGVVRQAEHALSIGSTCLRAACGLLLLTLALRGILSRHWPLGSQYEFSLAFAWIVSAIYLLVEHRSGTRRGGAGVTLILAALLSRAVFAAPQVRAMGPLPPVLRSGWLQAHVLTVLAGYGCVSVAAGLALADLGFGSAATGGWGAQRRLIEAGFPLLTLGILGGAIWAHYAWGRYWGWDPKETWSLVTWLWYLLMLHLPRGRSYTRRYAWLALAGLGCVLFTFVGVPMLAQWLRLDTLHGY